MFEHLESSSNRYDELERLLADPKTMSEGSQYQKYARERSRLQPIVTKYREYKEVNGEILKDNFERV